MKIDNTNCLRILIYGLTTTNVSNNITLKENVSLITNEKLEVMPFIERVKKVYVNETYYFYFLSKAVSSDCTPQTTTDSEIDKILYLEHYQ